MDVIEYLAVAGIGLGQTLHEIDELTGHRDPWNRCMCGNLLPLM
jgi:hypothetical protein